MDRVSYILADEALRHLVNPHFCQPHRKEHDDSICSLRDRRQLLASAGRPMFWVPILNSASNSHVYWASQMWENGPIDTSDQDFLNFAGRSIASASKTFKRCPSSWQDIEPISLRVASMFHSLQDVVFTITVVEDHHVLPNLLRLIQGLQWGWLWRHTRHDNNFSTTGRFRCYDVWPSPMLTPYKSIWDMISRIIKPCIPNSETLPTRID